MSEEKSIASMFAGAASSTLGTAPKQKTAVQMPEEPVRDTDAPHGEEREEAIRFDAGRLMERPEGIKVSI